jgi:hypothetical protein
LGSLFERINLPMSFRQAAHFRLGKRPDSEKQPGHVSGTQPRKIDVTTDAFDHPRRIVLGQKVIASADELDRVGV